MASIDKLLLQSNTVFSFQDMAYLWNLNDTTAIRIKASYLTKRKKLQRLRKGMYAIVGRAYDPLELANKLRTPSYISLETVLVQEGIMFQYYESIYSISNLSRTYVIDNKEFIYRKIKDEILLNPKGIVKDGNYMIATRERAVLDTLYLNKNYYFDNLNNFNFDKALELAEIYETNSLIKELIILQKENA